MSVSSSAQKQAGVSGNRPTYLKSFLEEAHSLVFLGYELIKPGEQEGTKEEDITELIANAINQLIEGSRAADVLEKCVDDIGGAGGIFAVRRDAGNSQDFTRQIILPLVSRDAPIGIAGGRR